MNRTEAECRRFLSAYTELSTHKWKCEKEIYHSSPYWNRSKIVVREKCLIKYCVLCEREYLNERPRKQTHTIDSNWMWWSSRRNHDIRHLKYKEKKIKISSPNHCISNKKLKIQITATFVKLTNIRIVCRKKTFSFLLFLLVVVICFIQLWKSMFYDWTYSQPKFVQLHGLDVVKCVTYPRKKMFESFVILACYLFWKEKKNWI